MTSKLTILIAGDRNIKDILAQRLPSRTCEIVCAGTFVAALSDAAEASAVVVDGQMPGYQELCAHLKGDPVTTDIPLIFLVHTGKEDPGVSVEASVPFRDPAALERALRQHCAPLALASGSAPEVDIPEPEPMEDDAPEAEEIFDERESTAMFRRPATEPGLALEWPPPPPERSPDQDMAAYARAYAGYFNSLIEAHQDLSRLSDVERLRLDQVSRLTLDDAESLIASVQAAMNEALREKDLQAMRVLSTAKNRLYEKRQLLRSMISDASTPGVPAEPGPSSQAAAIPEEGWDMDEPSEQAPVAIPSDGPVVDVPDASEPPVQKSALTLAAEAKDLERRKTKRLARQSARQRRQTGAQKAPPRKKAESSTSRGPRPGKPGYGWVWIPVAALLVLIASLTIYYSIGKREGEQDDKKTDNMPPAMKWVVIEQTPAGVVARPSAQDQENDRVTYSITWFNNGNPVEGERTARLKPQKYRPGEVIHVEVIPSDMHGQGRAMRSRELTIKEDFGGRRRAP